MKQIVRALNTSRNQNIVDLIEVIIDGTPTPGRLATVALVFEYLDHDLSGLLDTPEAANQITPALAKSYMMQLAAGVSELRERRDQRKCLELLLTSIVRTKRGLP